MVDIPTNAQKKEEESVVPKVNLISQFDKLADSSFATEPPSIIGS